MWNDFFDFSCLRFSQLLEYMFLSCLVEKFLAIITGSHYSFLSFWNSSDVSVNSFVLVVQVANTLGLFFVVVVVVFVFFLSVTQIG